MQRIPNYKIAPNRLLLPLHSDEEEGGASPQRRSSSEDDGAQMETMEISGGGSREWDYESSRTSSCCSCGKRSEYAYIPDGDEDGTPLQNRCCTVLADRPCIAWTAGGVILGALLVSAVIAFLVYIEYSSAINSPNSSTNSTFPNITGSNF